MSLPPLDRVDPSRAWLPPENHPWSLRWAGHLYRRAAFGATLDELRRAVKDGPQITLDRLLQGNPEAKQFESLIAETGASIAKGNDESDLRGWWLYVMLNSGHPLRERLTLFWHNHFATSIAKVRSTEAMHAQNQKLRRYALGKFGPLLGDISRDPAMLVWLDSNRNIKGQPNENYSREVMELFTLGVGQYKEPDIREAARAFTGWHTDGEAFTFAARFHDAGPKTFLGQSGPWDGTDVQRILLAQPAAAMFLVRKLYRYLIAETPEPPDTLLEPLAERLRHSDYDIADLVGTMLRSQHFSSEYAYRQRVKSPVEYALGVIRSVRPTTPPRDLVPLLESMGQSLFAPPNVKGWPGGKAWLNSATVLARQNFAQLMVNTSAAADGPKASIVPVAEGNVNTASVTVVDVAESGPGDRVSPSPPPSTNDIIALVERENAKDANAIVNLLADLLLQGDIAAETRKRLVAFFADGKPETMWHQRIRETTHALMTLPEYTLA